MDPRRPGPLEGIAVKPAATPTPTHPHPPNPAYHGPPMPMRPFGPPPGAPMYKGDPGKLDRSSFCNCNDMLIRLEECNSPVISNTLKVSLPLERSAVVDIV